VISPEPVYRVAEKEWKAFLESFTDLLIDVDPQIPHLPPKDVIHRIYRDVKIVYDLINVANLMIDFIDSFQQRQDALQREFFCQFL
jgi:hypothetical protein